MAEIILSIAVAVPHKRCKEFCTAQAAVELVGHSRGVGTLRRRPAAQPWPLRVIRATPCAPAAPAEHAQHAERAGPKLRPNPQSFPCSGYDRG